MGEIRAVDDQQNIRLCGYDRLRSLVDPRNQLRQFFEDLREPHDGKLGIIEQRDQPLRLKRLAADAHQLDGSLIPGFQGSDQIRAQKIAGDLAGYDRHFQRCRHSVMPPPIMSPSSDVSIPQTNMPA